MVRNNRCVAGQLRVDKVENVATGGDVNKIWSTHKGTKHQTQRGEEVLEPQ